MSNSTPGIQQSGTKDASVDFDSFTLSNEDEAAALKKANEFVDSQPELDADNDCGDACKI